MTVETMLSAREAREGRLGGDAAPSWQSRVINHLLRLLPIKRRTASAAAVQDYVRELALRPASYEPKGLGRGVEVKLKPWAGWPVYHTASVAEPDVKGHVLFLHGGGYVKEIAPAHWRFVGYLTREACVHCVVPIYPLAHVSPRTRAGHGRVAARAARRGRPGEAHRGRQFGGRRPRPCRGSMAAGSRPSPARRAGARFARPRRQGRSAGAGRDRGA